MVARFFFFTGLGTAVAVTVATGTINGAVLLGFISAAIATVHIVITEGL